ncbi:MAG TPA: hypothetical protein QF720_05200 [Nitrospinota bacterium]|jgi:hypothetical protein|nr:hypothetical protein [Nitrospinota bacterium]|tara:strand:- start:43260 stop:43457 length:198 start_codon:yes stop_codon:yes gene_type:complete
MPSQASAKLLEGLKGQLNALGESEKVAVITDAIESYDFDEALEVTKELLAQLKGMAIAFCAKVRI